MERESDGGERWGDEQRVRAGQWEAVMMLDCLHVSEGVKDYRAASADVHGPHAPFFIAVSLKLDLFSLWRRRQHSRTSLL